MAELLQREQLYTPLWQQIGTHLNLHRWAGLSGALAVIMAAYGAHGHQFKGDKQTFINGNQMHFFHTLVLLAMPLARRPIVVSTLHGTNPVSKDIFVCFIHRICVFFSVGYSLSARHAFLQRWMLFSGADRKHGPLVCTTDWWYFTNHCLDFSDVLNTHH